MLIGPESEFPKLSRKQKKAAKAARKAEKKAAKNGVKLLDPEVGQYSHGTELEEGLHIPQQTGQVGEYSPIAGHEYQPYASHVGNSNYV